MMKNILLIITSILFCKLHADDIYFINQTGKKLIGNVWTEILVPPYVQRFHLNANPDSQKVSYKVYPPQFGSHKFSLESWDSPLFFLSDYINITPNKTYTVKIGQGHGSNCTNCGKLDVT